jgi:hypothetical protein
MITLARDAVLATHVVQAFRPAGNVGSGFSRIFTLGLFVLIVSVSSVSSVGAQDTHVLVVVGVGGDEQHTAQFHKWAIAVVDAAKKGGVADGNITYLGERTELDAARMSGRSTRDGVTKAIGDIAARAQKGDHVLIVLIGHGSFDGRTGAFNLPGPDLTAADYDVLLDRLAAQRIAFVNTAPSSGAFLEPLAGANRAIVTATKSGGERNETRFPEFFVASLADPAADRDRNGRVSIQEAFDFAKQKVTTSYEQGGHIITEHATLNDGSEGKLAGTLYLSPMSERTAALAKNADPALKQLIDEREALERKISELRLLRGTLPDEQYEPQLEKLLLELAQKDRAIREREAKK